MQKGFVEFRIFKNFEYLLAMFLLRLHKKYKS